jgi:hypothetical protein
LHIVLVLHEASRLGRKSAASALTLCCLSDRLPRGLGTAQASAPSDLIERTQPVASET